MQDEPAMPRWAPRVSRHKISRLYRSDALGMRDEALLDEVGWAILARVESCLAATQAQRGQVTCPACGSVIRRDIRPGKKADTEILQCGACPWRLPWRDYNKTIHNKHLGCAGMLVPCRQFADEYPGARTYQEKIILIDTLIHRFHWQMEGHAAQPGAATIIGGTMTEVADFLDALSYGDQSTPGLRERLGQWRDIARDKAYGPTRTRNRTGPTTGSGS